MNHTLSDSQLEEMIKSAVNSSGPLPPDEKFSQLVSALRELQELRKAAMDSEPVAWRWRRGPDTRWHLASRGDLAGEVEPLYRHAQQPTVTGNRLSSALSLTQMQMTGYATLAPLSITPRMMTLHRAI